MATKPGKTRKKSTPKARPRKATRRGGAKPAKAAARRAARPARPKAGAARKPAVKKMSELATVIRSKNCKAFGLTLDFLFPSKEIYEKVRKTKVINRKTISKLYGISENEVLSIIEFDPGNAIKATIRRPIDCGAFGDPDVYGCQQHAPLFDIEVPWHD